MEDTLTARLDSPWKQPIAPDSAAPSVEAVRTQSMEALAAMCKLLVIDDEAGIRFSIQQIFRGDKYVVRTAETGREGLALIAADSPDVVLLDVRLGSESGLTILEEIRRQDPNCSVVLITGYATADTAKVAIDRGAFEYLVKPLDVSLLKQVVERAFKASQSMRTPPTLDTPSEP